MKSGWNTKQAEVLADSRFYRRGSTNSPGMDSNMKLCAKCDHFSATLHYQDDIWVCRPCYVAPGDGLSCRPFEFGHENPADPHGSTAHVRDIKARRLDPKTKTLFYYEKPKTYFFPK